MIKNLLLKDLNVKKTIEENHIEIKLVKGNIELFSSVFSKMLAFVLTKDLFK